LFFNAEDRTSNTKQNIGLLVPLLVCVDYSFVKIWRRTFSADVYII